MDSFTLWSGVSANGFNPSFIGECVRFQWNSFCVNTVNYDVVILDSKLWIHSKSQTLEYCSNLKAASGGLVNWVVVTLCGSPNRSTTSRSTTSRSTSSRSTSSRSTSSRRATLPLKLDASYQARPTVTSTRHPHFTLYTACILHTSHFTLYSTLHMLHNSHCRLHTTHIQYNVHPMMNIALAPCIPSNYFSTKTHNDGKFAQSNGKWEFSR